MTAQSSHSVADAARNGISKPWLAVLAVWLAVANVAAQDAASTPRFVAVEVHFDSPEPVAAWQFELADRAGAMRVVGIEGGGHDAFPRAPYYDREALARGDAPRIVLADYSLAEDEALPRGRMHLATMHLMLDGEPDFALRLIKATNAEGVPVTASIALGAPDPQEIDP